MIASHAGYRFGKQAYMLDPATIKEIARRDGVVGLILARHQLQDGRADGEGIDHTVETIRAHVDRIREVTGSNDHVGIGSDLDGFIKPTMSGIESAEDLAQARGRAASAYPDDADAILSGNALRVVTGCSPSATGHQLPVSPSWRDCHQRAAGSLTVQSSEGRVLCRDAAVAFSLLFHWFSHWRCRVRLKLRFRARTGRSRFRAVVPRTVE